MAKKRTNPTKSLEQRQIESTDEMARLAKESKYMNVSAHLTNLADRRRTALRKKQAGNVVAKR